jgi:hypothetical protein
MFTARAPARRRGWKSPSSTPSHANNVPLSLLSEAHRAMHTADGTGLGARGPPTGYVVKFTNGLTAYLSGDTGIHTEMKTVVNEYHHANLAVFNLGLSAGTNAPSPGPERRIRPASVIFQPPQRGRHRRAGTLRPPARAARWSSC